MFSKENYAKIKSEIPLKVNILAASKTKSIGDIKEAVNAGIKIIGENYVLEAEDKFRQLKDLFKEKNISFHLIGHLQSNKAKIAAAIFDCVQTIDSVKIACRLDECCRHLNKKLDVFIEINFEEKQKSGISINNLTELLEKIKSMQNLNLRGFMAIPPIGREAECFSQIKELAEKHNLPELSIGMSGNYKLAAENGSTLIRLGTILFGERK